MKRVLIKNARVFTLTEQGILEDGWVLIEDNQIGSVGTGTPPIADETYDASGKWLLPGFVQGHVHLCQVLVRGLAEDLELLEWLRTKIWPFEAAHTYSSLKASAQLGILELIASGTTAIADMATVHYTEAVFEAATDLGIRAVIGKAIMDDGEGVPPKLLQDGKTAVKEAVELAERFNGAANGRLRALFYPRFLLSVKESTFKETVEAARALGCMMHTHVSENPQETDVVIQAKGMRSVEFLHSIGFTGSDVVLVHAIHLNEHEFSILAESNTKVAHCPSANFKLGSGIADTPRMLDLGIQVSLGADGSPCNNNLSIFKEMRLAGLMQQLRSVGSLSAKEIVKMATLGGAAALGLQDQIGSIEVGKRADLVLLNPDLPHSYAPQTDPYTVIVYSMDERNVSAVWIDGELLFENGNFIHANWDEVKLNAENELKLLLERV